jgi:glucosamine--fructose-6-phosphate aminotransferase (isomerizing)
VGGKAFAEQVASQPAVVAGLVGIDVPRLDAARPLVLTGIGTSLHACMIAARWVLTLSGGEVRPLVLDAHDLALGGLLGAADQVVVVSHRGNKRYPNEVLRRAREAGATTITITGLGDADPHADVVLRTCDQERASTHTVSYTAALTVLARLVGTALGHEGQLLLSALEAVPDALRATLALPLPPAAVDGLVASAPHSALVCGTGLDALTAAEAALKIKEGTYRWAEAMHCEFALHGPPAVFSSHTVAYLIRPGAPDGGRHDDLRTLLGAIGAPVFVCADDPGADLPFARTDPLTRPFVAILPFQRLVAAAAAALGSDPDLTRLEAEPWASAIRAVSL